MQTALEVRRREAGKADSAAVGAGPPHSSVDRRPTIEEMPGFAARQPAGVKSDEQVRRSTLSAVSRPLPVIVWMMLRNVEKQKGGEHVLALSIRLRTFTATVTYVHQNVEILTCEVLQQRSFPSHARSFIVEGNGLKLSEAADERGSSWRSPPSVRRLV